MDFESLRRLQKDSERVDALYQIMKEDSRLNHSKAARVEFITTTTYIEKYLKEGDRILDLGAGAGEYSLYFARKGYEVTAVELASANIEAFQKKITGEDKIELIHGNALDLSCFAEDSFDVVLLFGPLYHLSKEEDRQKCITEAKRVLKPTGTIFFAFILNDMVILTELYYRQDFFLENSYDHETFKVEDFPFVFFTVDQTREMLQAAGIQILKEIASDGVSELLEDKINAMDEESYKQYVRYHLYCCEKPEMLGRSNHLLTIGKK
ncbi:class I SAM-dependent methyltransferase [Lachnoclostridium phytofermentans]|uniref:Methyltransferase type 11 n=1 Tax=Lachnoclostridium phytofermentans (strain ATCC 700394 / DSM 18823 / ISDg) TaxID=357809 RepID=A9KR97_LACP7|nr:class I SAM-dependent methyltransferase [Lachnoclostridium phytofermentans]ABX40565.1 Methyltransferase type 11 [Lachnoclostridium phytofermentans ISDg]